MGQHSFGNYSAKSYSYSTSKWCSDIKEKYCVFVRCSYYFVHPCTLPSNVAHRIGAKIKNGLLSRVDISVKRDQKTVNVMRFGIITYMLNLQGLFSKLIYCTRIFIIFLCIYQTNKEILQTVRPNISLEAIKKTAENTIFRTRDGSTSIPGERYNAGNNWRSKE